MMLITFFLFFIACIVGFYVPGLIFLNFLKLTLKPLEELVIAWFIGISLFLLSTYIFSWLNIPQAYLVLLLILNLYFFLKLFRAKMIFYKREKIDLISLLIVTFGSASFLYVMFFSGLVVENGINFLGVNGQDGIRHVAYIKSQISTFPPQHPGLAGVELKGFHYFYDFLLAKFSQFFYFTVEDLYFRLFPLLISVLYGASFYFLSQKMTDNLIARRLILFFAYFAQSFSIIVFVFNKNIDITGSPIVHPIGLIVNPFIVLAIGMLVAGIAILPEIKKSYKYAIIVGLIFGVLSQIKVHAGLIAIGMICIYFLYIFLRYKRKYLLNYSVLIIVTGFITSITFLPNNFRQGGLDFYPLAFYQHYISSHGFENLHWDIKRKIFEESKNYLRLIILYVQAVIIFWIFNLGVLSIIFVNVRDIFKKEFWLKDFNLLIFSSILIPIFIASFFLQSVSAFDTVQLLWITIPLIGIPAGIIFAQYVKSNRLFVFFIIFLLLLLSVPGYVSFQTEYSPLRSKYNIDKNQLEFFSKINHVVPEKSFIIYIPKSEVLDNKVKFFIGGTPVMSALSGRQIYLEGGNLPGRLDNIYSQRSNKIINLDKAIRVCDLKLIDEFLYTIGSRYILSENRYTCFTERLRNTRVASNNLNLYLYK